MLLDLDDDIVYEIFYKLYNYDIFNINATCKKFNNIINNKTFIDYILNRYHPIVFDSWDLYCHKCNLHIYRIGNNNIDSIWCKH